MAETTITKQVFNEEIALTSKAAAQVAPRMARRLMIKMLRRIAALLARHLRRG